VKVSSEFGKTVLMVTHDPNVARATDRIMRIEDGAIKEVMTPTKLEANTTASSSYIDQIKSRLVDLDLELKELDEMFRNAEIDGEEYTKRRNRLLNVKSGLQEELHRMGTVV
jgi:ABC-type sulfate/molybdate transport systems ATPase subunit